MGSQKYPCHRFSGMDKIWVSNWSRAILIGNCRNMRGLGKSTVVFHLPKKLRCSHERSTKFESLYQEKKYLDGENGKMVGSITSCCSERSLHSSPELTAGLVNFALLISTRREGRPDTRERRKLSLAKW